MSITVNLNPDEKDIQIQKLQQDLAEERAQAAYWMAASASTTIKAQIKLDEKSNRIAVLETQLEVVRQSRVRLVALCKSYWVMRKTLHNVARVVRERDAALESLRICEELRADEIAEARWKGE